MTEIVNIFELRDTGIHWRVLIYAPFAPSPPRTWHHRVLGETPTHPPRTSHSVLFEYILAAYRRERKCGPMQVRSYVGVIRPSAVRYPNSWSPTKILHSIAVATYCTTVDCDSGGVKVRPKSELSSCQIVVYY